MFKKKPPPTTEERAGRLMKGYFWCATAAAWTFAVSKAAQIQFDSAISMPRTLSIQLFQTLLMSCQIFAISLLLALIATFIPALFAWRLARQFSISNVSYFLAAGVLGAAIISPVLVSAQLAAMSASTAAASSTASFDRDVMNFLMFALPSGAVAGFVFWWVVGRFIGKTATRSA
jgi:hypothetical protein